MTKLIMRPYQQEAVDNVFALLQDSSSAYALLSMPTGTGKTPTFAEIARLRDRKTLILAHRDELISQAVEKVSWVWDTADIGVIQASRHEPNAQVVVASVQSMHAKRRQRLVDENIEPFGTIITDEAHHAKARSYTNIYDWCNALPKQSDDILHVGVTATPNRTDKKLLGDIFTNVAFERDILDFIPEYLSDLRIIRRDSGIVLDGISRTANDLNCHELSDALNTPQGNAMVVDAYEESVSHRQSTIAFCADIAHVHGLAEEFISRGIPAAPIDSTMKIDVRRKILKQFYDGHIKVLCNCGILTEGFDCPQVDCILLVRPTRSELLLRQMIGRGTRLYPGKDICDIVDIVCVSNDWDLVNPAQLFGFDAKTGDVTSVAEKKESQARSRKQYGDVDFNDKVAGIYDTRSPGNLYWQKIRWKGWILRLNDDGDIRILPKTDTLKSDTERYYVEYQKKEVANGYSRGSYTKILDDASLDQAFAFAESYTREHDFDIGMAKPKRRWHSEPATEGQLKYIRGLGAGEHITPELTKKEASELITFFKDLREQEDVHNS